MLSCDCLFAVFLLTSATESTPSAGHYAEFHHAQLLQLSVDQEILDPREETYFVARNRDFSGDLRSMQKRWNEFLHAPMLDETSLFAERKLINEFLTFNRGYRKELLSRLAVDLVHAEELTNAIAETDQLYHVWDTLRDARCDFYYVTVRRQALMLLRELIGFESFSHGQLPPHVPVWHFARLN